MTQRLLCLLALSALPFLAGCTEGSCGETRVENLETGRCDCRAEYVEVVNEEGIDVCILRTDFDGGPDVGIDAPGFDAGPGTDGCTETTLYRDRDRDGRGDPDDSITACADPLYVDNADDCDDTCNVCWTGAEEVCDTVDNDCDGFSDEGLTVPVGEPVIVGGENMFDSGATRDLIAERLDDGRWFTILELPVAGFASIAFDPTTGDAEIEDVVDVGAVDRSPTLERNADGIGVVLRSGSRMYSRAYSAVDGTARAEAREIINARGKDVRLRRLGGGYLVVYVDDDEDLYASLLFSDLRTILPPVLLRDYPDSPVRFGRRILLVPDEAGSRVGIIAPALDEASATLELQWFTDSGPSGAWQTFPDGMNMSAIREIDGEVWATLGIPPATIQLATVSIVGDELSFMPVAVRDVDFTGVLFGSNVVPIFLGSTPDLAQAQVRSTSTQLLVLRSDGPITVDPLVNGLAAPAALDIQQIAYLKEDDLDDSLESLAVRHFGCPE